MRARSTQCDEGSVPSDRDAERRSAHETVRPESVKTARNIRA